MPNQPPCNAVHASTWAVCELPVGHLQNHRGPFAHGISQWPEPVTPAPPEASHRALRDGVALIAEERRRQVEGEGWTPEHDDAHQRGEMIGAAINYATLGHFIAVYGRTDGAAFFRGLPPEIGKWLWELEWWKPDYSDPIRNLVKAGALIAAEIDRLQRASGVAAPSPARAEAPEGAQRDYQRLRDQALVIESILRAAGCPQMPLDSGVRWLTQALEQAQQEAARRVTECFGALDQIVALKAERDQQAGALGRLREQVGIAIAELWHELQTPDDIWADHVRNVKEGLEAALAASAPEGEQP